ncbi:hypothetical protein RFI_28270, partial [Reticulomyxa filosa]
LLGGVDCEDMIRYLMEARNNKPGKEMNLRENDIKRFYVKTKEILLDIKNFWRHTWLVFRYFACIRVRLKKKKELYGSRQTVTMLAALFQIEIPKKCFMSNHEYADINRIYGVLRRVQAMIFGAFMEIKMFTNCFNCLPVRPIEVLNSGLLCDLSYGVILIEEISSDVEKNQFYILKRLKKNATLGFMFKAISSFFFQYHFDHLLIFVLVNSKKKMLDFFFNDSLQVFDEMIFDFEDLMEKNNYLYIWSTAVYSKIKNNKSANKICFFKQKIFL